MQILAARAIGEEAGVAIYVIDQEIRVSSFWRSHFDGSPSVMKTVPMTFEDARDTYYVECDWHEKQQAKRS